MPEIHLSRGYTTLVDDQDFEWLSKYRSVLRTACNGELCYAHTKVNGAYVPMHRLIMGLPKGDQRMVHHVNGSGLDNRRDNLRILDYQTHAQHHHRGKHMPKTSVNVTTVTFPLEQAEQLREAVNHFGYESMATFFRLAGLALLEHYKRGDDLLRPMRFSSLCEHKK